MIDLHFVGIGQLWTLLYIFLCIYDHDLLIIAVFLGVDSVRPATHSSTAALLTAIPVFLRSQAHGGPVPHSDRILSWERA